MPATCASPQQEPVDPREQIRRAAQSAKTRSFASIDCPREVPFLAFQPVHYALQPMDEVDLEVNVAFGLLDLIDLPVEQQELLHCAKH